jgi:hypothetical protein
MRSVRRLTRRTRLAVVAGLSAFLVLAGTGVATAAWQTSTSVNSSVTAATAKMTLSTSSGALGTLYKFAGTPPTPPASATVVTVVKGVVVTNTGTAPLNYALAASIAAGNTLPATSVWVFLWTTTGTCSATIGAGATSGSLAGPLSMPLTAASAVPGVAFTLCIGTNLTTTLAASQGLSITPTFTVTGTVGTSPWTSSADATFTQSVYQMIDPTALTCTRAKKNVTLSWSAPVNTGSTGNVTYQIIEATSKHVLVPLQSGLTAIITPADLTTSPETLLVQAKEDQYGSTSAGTTSTMILHMQGKHVSCGP